MDGARRPSQRFVCGKIKQKTTTLYAATSSRGIAAAMDAVRHGKSSMHDMVIDDNSLDKSCDCETQSSFVGYDSGGCLPCVRVDSSFYIMNFVESIMDKYNIVHGNPAIVQEGGD